MSKPYSRTSREVVVPAVYSNQITITSETGVGSSSLLNVIKEKWGSLPYRFLSGGSLMRVFAANMDMTIEQLTEHNRDHRMKKASTERLMK